MSHVQLALVIGAVLGCVLIMVLAAIGWELGRIANALRVGLGGAPAEPTPPPAAQPTMSFTCWPTPGQLANMLGFATVGDMAKWRDAISRQFTERDGERP